MKWGFTALFNTLRWKSYKVFRKNFLTYLRVLKIFEEIRNERKKSWYLCQQWMWLHLATRPLLFILLCSLLKSFENWLWCMNVSCIYNTSKPFMNHRYIIKTCTGASIPPLILIIFPFPQSMNCRISYKNAINIIIR